MATTAPTTRTTSSVTTEVPSTTTASACAGWISCTNTVDDFLRSFPRRWWSTPASGGDACRVLRPVNSGDAGTGYIAFERVRGISLADFTSQLALPHGDFHWEAHSTVRRCRSHDAPRAGTDTIAADLPVVAMYAVEDGNDVVTVTSFSAGMSTDADDELASIATTVEAS